MVDFFFQLPPGHGVFFYLKSSFEAFEHGQPFFPDEFTILIFSAMSDRVFSFLRRCSDCFLILYFSPARLFSSTILPPPLAACLTSERTVSFLVPDRLVSCFS